jgi:hypothetical protein
MGCADTVEESRRQLTRDAMAIAAYALPVGLVYGLAALQAHFTLLDVVVTCLVVLAGGAQFAAAGLVKDGAPWLAIAGVTALVNARHLLYSAAVAPYTAERPRRERAFMAHFLTDETFALSLAHFRRIGRFDARLLDCALASSCRGLSVPRSDTLRARSTRVCSAWTSRFRRRWPDSRWAWSRGGATSPRRSARWRSRYR